MLPTVNGTCPTLQTGSNTISLSGKPSMTWRAWVGANQPAGDGGPIVIYWNTGHGATAQEAVTVMGQTVIDDIVGLGGMVLAPEATSKTGTTSTDLTWYTGDMDYADQIVACALAQQNIDARHIHTLGYLVGGLQSVYMWAARSGYIATAMSDWGGLDAVNTAALQDPSHPPAIVAVRGPDSVEGFYQSVLGWVIAAKQAGSFAIDCNDSAATMIAPHTGLAPEIWQFMKDHPFGVAPEPYSTLSTDWPTICTIYQ